MCRSQSTWGEWTTGRPPVVSGARGPDDSSGGGGVSGVMPQLDPIPDSNYHRIQFDSSSASSRDKTLRPIHTMISTKASLLPRALG